MNLNSITGFGQIETLDLFTCVWFIPFLVFFVKVILVKVTKKRKKQLSFSGKMQIFYTENKQADFSVFGHFDQKTKKRKME